MKKIGEEIEAVRGKQIAALADHRRAIKAVLAKLEQELELEPDSISLITLTDRAVTIGVTSQAMAQELYLRQQELRAELDEQSLLVPDQALKFKVV